MQSQRRSVKNVHLTKRYHWPYVGNWLALNLVQLALIEICTLFILSNLQGVGLAVGKLAIGSVVVCIAMIAMLCSLGVVWAHRLAGVHLRTESTFLKIAEGDKSVRLRYRDSDRLEDLELAFDLMMSSFEQDKPIYLEREEDTDGSDATGERRSWRNMQLTSRYHFSYMAIWVVISILQLIVLYFAGLFSLHTMNHPPVDVALATTVSSVLTLGLGFLILWRGMKSAHRLAGVHVRLTNVFHLVARGKRDLVLKFRAYDKLESLEQAFADMMTTLNQSVAPSES